MDRFYPNVISILAISAGFGGIQNASQAQGNEGSALRWPLSLEPLGKTITMAAHFGYDRMDLKVIGGMSV